MHIKSHIKPHIKARLPNSWSKNPKTSHTELKLTISPPLTEAHIEQYSPYSKVHTFANKTGQTFVLKDTELTKKVGNAQEHTEYYNKLSRAQQEAFTYLYGPKK